MTTEQYSIGYEEGYQAGWNAAMDAKPAQQEPVAWPCLIAEADFSEDTVTLAMQCTDYKVSAGKHWLSTTPPAQRKPWVGLTDEERKLVRNSVGYNQFVTAGEYAEHVQKATEAKLKQRNT